MKFFLCHPLKKAVPEIPPVLPFSKGGELFPMGSLKSWDFPVFERPKEERLLAFQGEKVMDEICFLESFKETE